MELKKPIYYFSKKSKLRVRTVIEEKDITVNDEQLLKIIKQKKKVAKGQTLSIAKRQRQLSQFKKELMEK